LEISISNTTPPPPCDSYYFILLDEQQKISTLEEIDSGLWKMSTPLKCGFGRTSRKQLEPVNNHHHHHQQQQQQPT
jgi:hypothetical protein